MGEDYTTSQLSADVKRIEATIEDMKRGNSEAHKAFWNEINELKRNDAVQDSKYDTILEKLSEVTAEVKSLQEVPKNNWRTLVQTVMAAIVSLIVGFVSAQLLK